MFLDYGFPVGISRTNLKIWKGLPGSGLTKIGPTLDGWFSRSSCFNFFVEFFDVNFTN